MRESLTSRALRHSVAALLIGGAMLSSSAHAQTSVAESRRAAGEAFDRGTSAMLANDFRAAAHFFEQAYHLAPAAVAIKQAIRAHDRAGNAFRAANLALRLHDNYPNDADGQALAADILGRFGAQYAEVHATCTECSILANDALVSENVTGTVRFFVQPNATVTVAAQFQYGVVTQETRGEPGSIVELPAFEAPPPPPEPEIVPGQPGGPVIIRDDGGTPVAVFYTMLGLTAAAGGFTIWSGVDTLAGVNAYEAAATSTDPAVAATAQGLYDDGHSKEIRTNIGIGVTSGMAAMAVVFAVTADWDGDPETGTPSARRIQGLAATVAPSQHGATFVVGGRF